jgi:hypothetical protein
MSITRSYNKHTDTYYAYETSYVWDEKVQKKVQKKQCIGKFDPITGKVIPNGKRGRPLGSTSTARKQKVSEDAKYADFITDAKVLSKRLKSVETSFEKLSSEVVQLSTDLDSLLAKMQSPSAAEKHVRSEVFP